MGKENATKGRRDLSFNLENETQNTAYLFLGMIGRQQSDFISKLIVKYLFDCGITDLSSLSVSDAKELCRTVSVDKHKQELSETLIYDILSAVLKKKSTVDFLLNSTNAGTIGLNTSINMNNRNKITEGKKEEYIHIPASNSTTIDNLTSDEIEDEYTDDLENDFTTEDDDFLPDISVLDLVSTFNS